MNLKPETTKRLLNFMIMGTVLCLIAMPDLALAFQTNPSFTDTGNKVCGFFGNVNNILNMSSIAVVTAAVVFSGYQIAFAHKRLSDVSSVLIGGVMIGAAGQVAKMVIGDTGQQCSSTTMVIQHLIDVYA
ncbi:MAG TPA: TrbC/VirB2 family protein [Dyella sp.]|uniref:TrbC/VirB2 family protein n=1 Tax=Dyella sp. TaxID=1869338 RepID=UPI002F91DBD8